MCHDDFAALGKLSPNVDHSAAHTLKTTKYYIKTQFPVYKEQWAKSPTYIPVLLRNQFFIEKCEIKHFSLATIWLSVLLFIFQWESELLTGPGCMEDCSTMHLCWTFGPLHRQKLILAYAKAWPIGDLLLFDLTFDLRPWPTRSTLRLKIKVIVQMVMKLGVFADRHYQTYNLPAMQWRNMYLQKRILIEW